MDKVRRKGITCREAQEIYDCEVVEYQNEFRLLLNNELGANFLVPKESFCIKDDLGREDTGAGYLLRIYSHLLAERLGLDTLGDYEMGFIFGDWAGELPPLTSHMPLPDIRVTNPVNASIVMVTLEAYKTDVWATILPKLAKMLPLPQILQVRGQDIRFVIPLDYCPIQQNTESAEEFDTFRREYAEITREIATNEWNNTLRNGVE